MRLQLDKQTCMQTHTCTHAHTVSFTEFFMRLRLKASKHKNDGIAWLYTYIFCFHYVYIVLSSHFHQLFHACSFSACWFRDLSKQSTWLDKIPYGWVKEIIICPTCHSNAHAGWWYHTLPWVCCTGILEATGRGGETGREVLADLEVVSLTSVSARLKFIMCGTKCLLIG